MELKWFGFHMKNYTSQNEPVVYNKFSTLVEAETTVPAKK